MVMKNAGGLASTLNMQRKCDEMLNNFSFTAAYGDIAHHIV